MSTNTVSLVGILVGAFTTLVGFAVTIYLGRKNGKKIDAVKVIVNGNLMRVQNDLQKALARIDNLQQEIEDERAGPRHRGPRPHLTAAQLLAESDAASDDAGYPGTMIGGQIYTTARPRTDGKGDDDGDTSAGTDGDDRPRRVGRSQGPHAPRPRGRSSDDPGARG